MSFICICSRRAQNLSHLFCFCFAEKKTTILAPQFSIHFFCCNFNIIRSSVWTQWRQVFNWSLCGSENENAKKKIIKTKKKRTLTTTTTKHNVRSSLHLRSNYHFHSYVSQNGCCFMCDGPWVCLKSLFSFFFRWKSPTLISADWEIVWFVICGGVGRLFMAYGHMAWGLKLFRVFFLSFSQQKRRLTAINSY